jgi:Xaa-Pro aminopeptidase
LGVLEEKKKKKIKEVSIMDIENEEGELEEEEEEEEEINVFNPNQPQKKILTPEERKMLDKAAMEDDVALLNIINSVYKDNDDEEEGNSL